MNNIFQDLLAVDLHGDHLPHLLAALVHLQPDDGRDQGEYR